MSLRIRVVSYNIHKCRGLDRRISPERIASIIRELNADAVALQEILDVREGRPEFDQRAGSLLCWATINRVLGRTGRFTADDTAT